MQQACVNFKQVIDVDGKMGPATVRGDQFDQRGVFASGVSAIGPDDYFNIVSRAPLEGESRCKLLKRWEYWLRLNGSCLPHPVACPSRRWNAGELKKTIPSHTRVGRTVSKYPRMATRL